MLPKYHALAAVVTAAPLAAAGWSLSSLAAFVGAAVLIDGDHYLGYVWQTGDFSLARAYAFHRKRYFKPHRWRFRLRWPHLGVESGRALHSAPVIALVCLVAWRWRLLRPIALGLLFHRLQDELYGSFD